MAPFLLLDSQDNINIIQDMHNKNIVIREFAQEDLTQAANFTQRVALPYLIDQGLSEKAIKILFSKHDPVNLANKTNNNYFFVAEDTINHKIVGVIGLRKDENSDTPNRLSTFYIDQKYQGKGIGTMLYERVKTEAIKNGCTKLKVNSSLYAETIYTHWGFKKISSECEEFPDGSKLYTAWMEKDL